MDWIAAKVGYDEALTANASPRELYDDLVSTLQGFDSDEIGRREQLQHVSLVNQGITFTVYGREEGVERIFPVQSPSVEKVEVKSRGHVRRSRLYYLRGLRGKKARLQSKVRNLAGLMAMGEKDQVEAGGVGASEAALEGEIPEAAEAGSDEEKAES